MIRDVINEMTEWLDQSPMAPSQGDLELIARWRDELADKLDSVKVEEKTNPGDPVPFYQGSVSGESIEDDQDGGLTITDEAGTFETTVEQLEQEGYERLLLAEKGREIQQAVADRIEKLKGQIEARS